MNLYWWNEIPNVGDSASRYLISRLSSDSIVWKMPHFTILGGTKRMIKKLIREKQLDLSIKGYVFPWEKCIFGIGSILDYSNRKTIVWGSGFREEYSKFNGGEILSVRGKLSANKLKRIGYLENIPIGDPALLLPLVYNPCRKKQGGIKLVPHFMEYDEIFKEYGSRYDVIDIRTDDVESFIDQIIDSDYILSTSLHGIIIAHAYGIPALWIKKGYIASSGFKFYDYFSSVGIELYDGYDNIQEILSSKETVVKLFEENVPKSHINVSLCEIQSELLRVAPFKTDRMVKYV